MSSPSRTPFRPPYAHPGILALVFVGGVIGTLIRALIEDAVAASPGEFPVATLVINLTGAFILGAFYAGLPLFVRSAVLQRRLRPLIGAGVIGGYTTYSTFVVESYALADSQHFLVAVAYMVISVVCGIFLAAVGAWLVRLVDARRTSQQPVEGDQR